MAEDKLRPMAIKSIASSVADDIVSTARREDMTVGELVEKVWNHWKGDGAPLTVREPPKLAPADLARLMSAAAEMKQAGLPVPEGARSLIAESIRGIRGVQLRRKPGLALVEGPASPAAEEAA